jgi:hypothetical protein
MSANCLERNIFGDCDKSGCCFFHAYDLLDNVDASKKIIGHCRITRESKHDK